MSDMLDKIKDLLDGEISETPEEEVEHNTGPPLEEAVTHAIHALEEIALYCDYGRANTAAEEARSALVIVTALKEKYDEQVRIMEALTNNKPEENENDS